MRVEVRDTIEFTLTSETTLASPYLDADVTADFIGPGGLIVSRPAFWDGGSTWKLRFAPPTAGEWTYRTREARELAGLHGAAGTFEAIEYHGDHPAKRHGYLEVAPSGRHLQHADGTPFFWLGDTHWRFAWERWDEANKPGWTSQFRDTVDLRVQQGFNVYQGNMFSWTPPEFWTEGEDYSSIDPDYFRNVVDPRMAYIASSGLIHALGLAWYHAIDKDPAGMVRLARYVVARYGSYPIVWTLGGEVAGYDPERRTARLDAWREVALAIQDADAYGHLITAHLTNERPVASYYQDEEWLSFTLNQLGHGDLDMNARHWGEHLEKYPDRPLIEGESLYEGLKSVEYTGRRVVTDLMVRQVAYRAIQSGCCGYSYGGQGCWNGAWDAEEARISWGSLPWFEGVDLAGAVQMGHLRRLYESLDWTGLRPAPHFFEASNAENEIFYRPAVSADNDGRTIVIYFAETYRFEDGAGTLRGLLPHPYKISWFDPRSGERTSIAAAAMPDGGELVVPPAPGEGDWVLTVQAI